MQLYAANYFKLTVTYKIVFLFQKPYHIVTSLDKQEYSLFRNWFFFLFFFGKIDDVIGATHRICWAWMIAFNLLSFHCTEWKLFVALWIQTHAVHTSLGPSNPSFDWFTWPTSVLGQSRPDNSPLGQITAHMLSFFFSPLLSTSSSTQIVVTFDCCWGLSGSPNLPSFRLSPFFSFLISSRLNSLQSNGVTNKKSNKSLYT